MTAPHGGASIAARKVIMSNDIEITRSNCFGCGRALFGELSQHQPLPNVLETDRCSSRPGKYMTLRCRFAARHQCVHSALVTGTGVHYWRDPLAAA